METISTIEPSNHSPQRSEQQDDSCCFLIRLPIFSCSGILEQQRLTVQLMVSQLGKI